MKKAELTNGAISQTDHNAGQATAQPNLWTEAGARFCPRRVHRFTLWRRWGGKPGSVLWVMLNPSTADEHVLDPTIRRCAGFTAAWGFEALTVVNLFSLRSTNPRMLYTAADAGGGEANQAAILDEAGKAAIIVAAWGNHGAFGNMGWRTRLNLKTLGLADKVHHLGLTKLGHPKHPLYVPGSTERQPWA